MTEGKKIIKELGKRGLRGYFFSYAQYKELITIQGFEQSKSKIIDWGFDVRQAESEIQIVDCLEKNSHLTKIEKGCLGGMLAEPLFWLLLALSSCYKCLI